MDVIITIAEALVGLVILIVVAVVVFATLLFCSVGWTVKWLRSVAEIPHDPDWLEPTQPKFVVSEDRMQRMFVSQDRMRQMFGDEERIRNQ